MFIGGYERVVITGATGWVGRNAVDVIAREAGGAVQGRMVLSSSRPRLALTPYGEVETVSTAELVGLVPGPRTLIIHCGFPTQDQVDVMGEAAYVDAITRLRVSMQYVLERLGAVDVVYISSGAATSVAQGHPVARRTHVYGQAKLDDEAAYTHAVAESGGRLGIVRAFALSGPYMTKPETYALGSLIQQAQSRGAVEVMADRPVRRSYMAIDDMLRIALASVQALDVGRALSFETAGEVVEVGELARRVLSVLGHDPHAVTRPPIDPHAPANDYLGDPATVSALAAVAGVIPGDLDAQIAVTAEWLGSQA